MLASCRRVPARRLSRAVMSSRALPDARVERGRLQLERAAVLIEDAPLIGQRGCDIGPVGIGFQRCRNGECSEPGVFSREPRLERPGRVELLAQRFRRGTRLRGVDPEQDLALFHVLGLLDEDLLDDAALQMLDRLAIALDRDPGRRDGGSIERGQRGPQAERPEYDADGGVADDREGAVIGESILG